MNQNRKHAPVSWKRGLVSLLVAMLVLNLCMPGIVTRAEELPAQEATAQIPEEGTVLPEGGAAEENLQPLTEEDSQEEITKEDTKEDTTEEYTSEDITEEEITTGEDPAVEDTEVVSEIRSVNTIVTDAAVSGQQMETEVELSALEQMNAYYDQAVAAGDDAETSVYAEIYNGAMAVYTAAGSPSEADDPELYYAMGMVVMTLQGYGYNPYAVSTLEVRDIQYYRGDVDVYWDETNGTTTASESHITSLTLNGMSVLKADSSKGSGWSGTPYQVEDYYTSASTSNDQSVKLSITPADGYYVTRVTVACCPATVAPYKCSTWQAGNAFDSVLSITAGGTITMDLSVVAFCHDNNNKENSHQYFILVQTAPLPSPLYVEYDYGEIVDILTNAGLTSTPFDSPATWTSVGSAFL